MNTKKTKKSSFANLVMLIIAVLFPFAMKLISSSSNYLIQIGVFILIYSIAASGLDILYGYCGQISMGHAGFFAIGAYGSALLNDKVGMPIPLSAFIACLAAAGIGALIAFPASKLKFHFLSLATIAFGEIILAIVQASPGQITGNFRGYFPQKIVLWGLDFSSDYTLYFYLTLFILVISLAGKQAIVYSKTGRSFAAIRENAVAAGGMGIDIRKYKVLAFSLSAFYVAAAGALYGHFVNYISPSLFSYNQSVSMITMLLFGGSGCQWGPILGVAVVQIMNELLRYLEQYQMLFYGILMLIVILFMPNGLINFSIRRNKKKEVSK